MSEVVASFQLATFTSPTDGDSPISATTVKGNDNTIRTSYNSHDADAGIHLQSSTLAARPAAATVGRKWLSTDGLRIYYDTGSAWSEIAYLSLAAGGTVAGATTFTLAPTFSSGTASQTMELGASKELVTVAITGTGNYVKSASPTLTGTAVLASFTASGTAAITGAVTLSSTAAVAGEISSPLATGSMLRLGNVTNDGGYNHCLGVGDGNGLLISYAGQANAGAKKVALLARDSGTGSYLSLYKPDGTTIGAKVDATTGFVGTHSTNALYEGVLVKNTSGGASAAGRIRISDDAASSYYMQWFGNGYTPTMNRYLANGGLLECDGAGGICVAATAVAGKIRFFTNGDNERLKIDNIGVITHTATAASGNRAFYLYTNGASPYGHHVQYGTSPNNGANDFAYFEDSTALRCAMRSNGGISNFSANNVNLSDSRAKEAERPLLGSQWDVFEKLKVRKYKYLDQTHGDWNYGLIAQEVLKVDDHFVDEDSWKTPDGESRMSLFEADIHYAHIRVTQELQERVKALEARL